MELQTKTFDSLPCYVELLGHNKVAARVSEAYGGLLRLDVPATDNTAGFTQFINTASVYRMTVITEEVLAEMSAALQVRPIKAWQLPTAMEDDDDFL